MGGGGGFLVKQSIDPYLAEYIPLSPCQISTYTNTSNRKTYFQIFFVVLGQKSLAISYVSQRVILSIILFWILFHYHHVYLSIIKKLCVFESIKTGSNITQFSKKFTVDLKNTYNQ